MPRHAAKSTPGIIIRQEHKDTTRTPHCRQEENQGYGIFSNKPQTITIPATSVPKESRRTQVIVVGSRHFAHLKLPVTRHCEQAWKDEQRAGVAYRLELPDNFLT